LRITVSRTLLLIALLTSISHFGCIYMEENLSRTCLGISQQIEKYTCLVRQEESEKAALSSHGPTIVEDSNGRRNYSYGFGGNLGPKSSVSAYGDILKISIISFTSLKYWIDILRTVKGTHELFIALVKNLVVFSTLRSLVRKTSLIHARYNLYHKTSSPLLF